MVMAVGGSTNAVLHLIAMARAVERAAHDRRLPEGRATACRISPTCKPSGKYVQEDLHNVGGTPAVMKYAAREGPARRRLPDGHRQDDRREPRRAARPRRRARTIVHPLDEPDQSRPATSASCAATSAPTARSPRSPARKGCSSPAPPTASTPKKTCSPRMQQKQDQQGRRRRHPLRRPARRPRHARDAHAHLGRSWAPGLAKDVALITDGRFSGGSHGFIVGHVTPEAQDRRPDRARARTATRSRSTPKPTRSTSTCPPTNSPSAASRLESPALQSHPRHALQVHQEREERLRRLRDGRMTLIARRPRRGLALSHVARGFPRRVRRFSRSSPS